MLKNVTRLEHKIGERVYHLFCDSDSPLAEVKDCLVQFMGHVANIENAAKAQAASTQSEAVPEKAPNDVSSPE